MNFELRNKGIKLLPLLFILFAVVARILPHPANVAPITALTLFSAVYLPKRYAFVLPIAALLLSDLVIGFYGITMLFVYGSILLTGGIGLYLRKNKSIVNIIGASLTGSILFFIISNFGVWIDSRGMYAHNLSGLIDCYIAAIPFFRNTLIGDLTYSGLFFGGYIVIGQYLEKALPKRIYKFLV